MEEFKDLPVTLDIDFTVNLMNCLPLCIVTANENLRNWLNVNFMLPVACIRPDGVLEYIMTDGMSYGAVYQNPASILRHSFVTSQILKNTEDIVGLLIGRIDLDWYSVIFLDQYYVPNTFAFQYRHFAHEALVYGYDKSREIFKAVIYGRKMCFTEITFAQMRKSYTEVFPILSIEEGWQEYTLMLYQFVKHTEAYPYDQDLFEKKLKIYMEGALSDVVYFENLLYMRCDKQSCFLGVKANEAMLKKMEYDKKRFLSGGWKEKRENLFGLYSPIYTYSEFHRGC